MKSIRVLIVCLLFTCSGFSQQIIEVIDGFTLEPVDTFDLKIIAGRAKIKQTYSGTILIEKVKKGTKILLTNPNYMDLEIEVSGKKRPTVPTLFIPTENLLNTYHSRYAYYSNPVQTEDTVFNSVDEPASFIGDAAALKKYIAETVNYPEKCMEYGTSGKVYLKFIVEKDGTVSNVKVLKGVNQLMDAECVRVVKKMPRWKPAKNKGIVVRSYFNLPIAFSLL